MAFILSPVLLPSYFVMRFQYVLASLAGLSAILASPTHHLLKRCTNSADGRSCWGDYDISTNYYEESPDTGVIREYWWEITNTTAAPDGIERIVLSVNGTIPGPTIYADWGDTIGESRDLPRGYGSELGLRADSVVVVHVTNGMANNGTSIHFHGVRQNYTKFVQVHRCL